MRQFLAFTKKEWREQLRTGKFWVLAILFLLFGVSAPAMAKMTPWLYETMRDSLAEQGLVVQAVTVTAFTSWQQFYKNVSIMLLVFVIMASGTLTGEYQKETLIPVLTKGLPRWKVIVSKSLVQILCWSICYWMAFGVTQLYTFWFWREDEVKHWFLAGSCIYFMGIWLILLMVLISAWLENNLNVLLGVGGVTLLCYLAGMWKKTASWMPTRLLQAGKLLEGALKPKDFFGAIGMALAFGVLFMMLAIAVFNKKKI